MNGLQPERIRSCGERRAGQSRSARWRCSSRWPPGSPSRRSPGTARGWLWSPIVGALLVIAGLAVNARWMASSLRLSRKTRIALNVAGSTLLMLAAVVLINLILSRHYVRFDLTEKKNSLRSRGRRSIFWRRCRSHRRCQEFASADSPELAGEVIQCARRPATCCAGTAPAARRCASRSSTSTAIRGG